MDAAPLQAGKLAPLISLAGISKSYRNGITALDNVDLDIASGSFVSLLGPSGCGKSTLLRIAAGLVAPSRGTRVFAGAPPNAEKPDAGTIGFVFQEPTLMPWATVADNIHLPLRLAGMGRREAAPRIEEAIQAMGLGGFAGSYPRELSGGMKMRVSIARAFVTRPRLLLLDEPFAALDEITRLKLNEDLLSLWESVGWTVIFVTHSVFESVFLSNRIVILSARPGRIVADLAVDLPYPRATRLRMTPEYGSLCQFVSERLGDAMRLGGSADHA